MANVAPLVPQPIAQPLGERRLLFHSLTWQRYQTLRETLCRDRGASSPENRNLRFIYLHGKLEVTLPLEVHEFSARLNRTLYSHFGRGAGAESQNHWRQWVRWSRGTSL